MTDPKKPDFAALARAAEGAHEDRKAEAAAKRANEKAESDRRFKAAIDALERDVAPLLREAETAFSGMSIPSVIQPNWGGIASPIRPQLSFQLDGPITINTQSGRTHPKSIKAFFSHDSEVLRIGFGAYPEANSADMPHEIKGDASAAVEAAIKHVLDSYYRSKETLY